MTSLWRHHVQRGMGKFIPNGSYYASLFKQPGKLGVQIFQNKPVKYTKGTFFALENFSKIRKIPYLIFETNNDLTLTFINFDFRNKIWFLNSFIWSLKSSCNRNFPSCRKYGKQVLFWMVEHQKKWCRFSYPDNAVSNHLK